MKGFGRDNLSLAIYPKKELKKNLIEYLNQKAHQSGIVYCLSRNETDEIAGYLNKEGFNAISYHAGKTTEYRNSAQDRFMTEDGLIMVATIAFGMGIDKSDIRFVIHASLPGSIEAYYQEIGRGGRDGAPAETLTLFGTDDIRLRRSQIDEGLAPSDRKFADHARLNALLGLAEAHICRRSTLLEYFGETCTVCNNCTCWKIF